MSWSRVGGAQSPNAGAVANNSSGTVTCAEDDLVFFAAVQDTAGGSSSLGTVSLKSGATGTIGTVTTLAYDNTSDVELAYGWCRVTGAGTVGLTVAAGGASAPLGIAIEVWRGGDTSATPIRGHSHANSGGVAGTGANSGTVTPTAGDLLVGLCLNSLDNSPTYTVTSGWDERLDAEISYNGSTLVETTEAASGSAVASAPTFASANWVSAIMAVKLASVSSSTAPWWTRGGLNGGMQTWR